MALNQWFEKGITPDEYIKSLEKHKVGFSHIYANFSVPEDESFLQSVREKELRVIVLAEPWCGHCMLNIPVLLRLSEKTNMPVRFLPRDENLELMDQYLTNGKSRTIPIFIFIDNDGNEVTKWGPIAERTKQFVDQYREKLPAKDSPDYDEKFKEMIEFMANTFKEDNQFWSGSYESMKQTLLDSIK